MYQLADPGAPQQWLLKRNCSLSPAQLAACFSALGCISLLIAAVFAANGAWPIVVFSGLEILALALAFFFYGRHAADYERIFFDGSGVVVETVCADRLQRVRLGTAWLKIDYQEHKRELIRLAQGGQCLFVGRYVAQEQRKQLAEELRSGLVLLNRVDKS